MKPGPGPYKKGNEPNGPTLQDPTTCQAPHHLSHPRSTTTHPKRGELACTGEPAQRVRRQLIDVPPVSNPHDTFGRDGATWTPQPRPPPPTGEATGEMPVLLRKEVIQPHLPVRLPCYDLVPIASPTFDGSSSYELGHRLRVLPTFVT